MQIHTYTYTQARKEFDGLQFIAIKRARDLQVMKRDLKALRNAGSSTYTVCIYRL
jgi:hypothetical protein